MSEMELQEQRAWVPTFVGMTLWGGGRCVCSWRWGSLDVPTLGKLAVKFLRRVEPVAMFAP